MQYSVIDKNTGDIYLTAEDVDRKGSSIVYKLSNENLEVLISIQIDRAIKFMIIDYNQNEIILCGDKVYDNGKCYPYDLATLTVKEKTSSTCIVSSIWNRNACTPTSTDVAAFFSSENENILYIATTPEFVESRICETPRFASRNTMSTTDSYLKLLSSPESKEGSSALYLSTYTNTVVNTSDATVYGFSLNGFGYFIGTYESNSGPIARISRVCLSDSEFKSYMEIPLQCRQGLISRVNDVIPSSVVTWAQMTQASQSMAESLGYTEGEDVLYYIMSMEILCVVPMTSVEAAFQHNIQRCLDGRNLTVASPETRHVLCPRNEQIQASDAVCGIPGDLPALPLAGGIPLFGEAVMYIDRAKIAEVITTGKHSIISYSDGEYFRERLISSSPGSLPQLNDYTPSCPRINKQLLLHPDSIHNFILEGVSSESQDAHVLPEGRSTKVTKHLSSNCTVNLGCSSCVSDPYCGWCRQEKRCTLEALCPSGEWLQQDASSFYREDGRFVISPVCVYIDLVGEYWVQFSPDAGLLSSSTELTVNITSEKSLPIYLDTPVLIYIGDIRKCDDVELLTAGYNETELGLTSSNSGYSYLFRCRVPKSLEKYETVVSVLVYDFPYGINLWLNSTEKFKIATPVFGNFMPTKGPESGGTLLEITGEHLLTGNSINITIAGVLCQLRRAYSTNERLFCITGSVPNPMDSRVTITYEGQYTVESIRRYIYTEDPFIELIYPLRTFVGGGAIQYITGTNLDSIARPQFVVVMSINSSFVDEFKNDCKVWNATSMTCPSPEINISATLEESTVKRSTDDEECYFVTRTASGDPVEFQIGFIMDGVEAWLPSYIDQYLDQQYTTLTVARDPVFYTFAGDSNITSFNPEDDQYLVIEGERLDCGAMKQDMTVEVGVDFCKPIISLYGTQLTCKPPEDEPPIRNIYATDHGLPHVSVKVGTGSVYHIGYIEYQQSASSGIQGWVIAIAVCVILLVVIALAAVVIYFVLRDRGQRKKGKYRVSKLKDNDYEIPGPHQSVTYTSPNGAEGDTVYLYPEDKGKQETITEQLDEGLRLKVQDALIPSDKLQLLSNYTLGKGKQETITEQLDEGLRLQVQDALIPSDKLQLLSNDMLGKGQFGRVVLGEFTDKNGHIRQVAVKSLKKNTNIDDVRKFLEEGIMMKDFDHPNVLSLIGVCIDEDQSPLIILPYMKYGDLKSYIEITDREFTLGKLITFSLNVAQGMAYLASLKFVHRDLAARNCMVDESETIKVSDFGLSRDIYEREYYASEDKKAKLPIRWMPLESITNNIYNVKTDVWSYGVLVWELLTRGELPYASVDSWDISNYLEKGKRLPQPAYAPDVLYELLLKCWHQDPSQRPDFSDICQQLQDLLSNGEQDDENYYLQLVQSPHYMALSD
ncbi:hepatocyte growth factor receptor-like [Glandiceps talaboti]